jgi:hypothetical protein
MDFMIETKDLSLSCRPLSNFFLAALLSCQKGNDPESGDEHLLVIGVLQVQFSVASDDIIRIPRISVYCQYVQPNSASFWISLPAVIFKELQ